MAKDQPVSIGLQQVIPPSQRAVELSEVDIAANAECYLADSSPTARFTSFDYCFNHFQSYRGRLVDLLASANLELTCLHLGFYLASWGMFRGSSPLLRRSIRHYVPLIETIAACPDEIWDVDAHNYGDGALDLLLDTADSIRAALPDASDTLVTKVMLGVFGCVPAFDAYFRKGFRVSTFGAGSLYKVRNFYEANARVVDRFRVPTLDFTTGEPTNFLYTRAKVIDMVFFIEGGYTP